MIWDSVCRAMPLEVVAVISRIARQYDVYRSNYSGVLFDQVDLVLEDGSPRSLESVRSLYQNKIY